MCSSSSSEIDAERQELDELRDIIRPVVKLIVTERTQDAFLRDDLIQEGMIAAWRTIATGLDNGSGAYIRTAIRNRVNECLSSDSWTGQEMRRGKPKDPLRNPSRTEFDVQHHDTSTQAGPYEALRLDLTEVLQAVSELPLREQNIVLRRFWAGYTVSEAARATGIATKTAESLWTNNTKPFLAQRLAHLRKNVA